MINIKLIIQFILLEIYLGYYNSILSHRTFHVMPCYHANIPFSIFITSLKVRRPVQVELESVLEPVPKPVLEPVLEPVLDPVLDPFVEPIQVKLEIKNQEIELKCLTRIIR